MHLQNSSARSFLEQDKVELHSSQFILENLTWNCIVLFLLQHFEKLMVKLTPDSIYIEEECGVNKYTKCSIFNKTGQA